MSDSDAEYNKIIQQLFKDFKTEIEKRQVSSSENFDKSILTYSSWALGISIAFLKDFIPITLAKFPSSLYWSWGLFCYAIATTTLSFLISYKGLELTLDHGEKYYLEDKAEYLNKGNIYNVVVKWINRTSGASFIIALILTVVFVSLNLEKSAVEKNRKPHEIVNKSVSKDEIINKGLGAPAMQQRPSKPVQSTQTPASVPQTQQPSSGTGGSGSN
jgi:hypothetical protein